MERIANNVQNPDSKEMIFTEDIKNMIYLMENTVENHELFKGLLNKYKSTH